MKLIETTNPRAHVGARTLFSEATAGNALELVRHLHFHLLGLYYAEVGPDWSSAGRRESDFLHHIDIAFTGRRQVVHGQHVVDLLPGWAYYLPGNMPVERRCAARGEVLFLKFRCEWLPGVDPLLDWPERRPTPIGPVDVAAWRDWLKPGWKFNTNHLLQLQAQIESWMATVLPDLDKLISRHLETHAQFTAVFRRLEAKLGADLRIADLAKVYGTSLHAFSMAFAANTGISPKEYLNRRLNQEAIQLVLNTDLKVKAIAQELRFTSEFYFSRFFQKLNGAAPTLYRQRFRHGA